MLNLSRLLTNTMLLLGSLAVANLALADPSGRVALVTDFQGSISYSPAGETEWVDVVRNRPLILGDRLWSAENSQAEFQVGSSAVRLGSSTSVEILDLNNNIAQLKLDQGSVNVSIRRLYKGQTVEVDTPMLAFSINRSGRYRIDVDPYDGQTTVSVWKGAGTAYGQDANFRVKAGEAVAFYDVNLRDYEIYGLADEDNFDRYAAARDQSWTQSPSLQYVDDDMVGYAALDTYGSWNVSASYGNVWYPSQVSAGWAPYRDGHWVWQEPWGWTWVDNAPWGFAPSHYGRWVSVSNRWGWVPGPRHVRPIYAPAVVAFVGGSNWGVSVSIGGGGGQPIGWFPIGPQEVYVPSYPASRDYFNQVNVNNTVVNNTTITNVYNNYSNGTINVNQDHYANRNVENAVTVVPSNVFVNAQPVAPAVVRVDRKKLMAGETMRIAQVAPSERSVIGAGKVAKVHPEKAVDDRQVVVHNAPPPAELPFAKREKQLQKSPGLPVNTATADAGQGKEGKPARNVLVVTDQQAAVDARTAATGRKSQSGKTEQLDRSAQAQKASRPAKGTAPQAQGAQQQQADTDKQAAQQKADADKQAAQGKQRQADSDKQAARQQQQQADADKQAAQQKQKQADSDKQAAQGKQRQADSDKQAAKQQQQQADADKQAAQQKQKQADSDKQAARQQQQADTDKQAAQQKQRQADSDKQAAKQQQQQADADKQAAQQKQRQADSDKQAAKQQQQQSDADKQAAQQKQRQAEADRQAAQQKQRQADIDKQAARQQQQQADADKQAAQQKQKQADSANQAAKQQQQNRPPQGKPVNAPPQPQGKGVSAPPQPQGNPPGHAVTAPEGQATDGKQQKSKSQADCEHAAKKNHTDPALCRDQ